MLAQELVKISRRFIGRIKFTSQDLDHFSHTSSGSGFKLIRFVNLLIILSYPVNETLP